jgi:hypothetical protein
LGKDGRGKQRKQRCGEESDDHSDPIAKAG